MSPSSDDARTVNEPTQLPAPTRGQPDSGATLPHEPAPTVTSVAAPHQGLRIGNYEVLGELGRGGMGVVYKARDLRLQRVVALKMILQQQHAGEAELIRFRREAEAAARLQHPNIVQIYEIGESEGCPFLTLEFVEGGNLFDLMERERLDPRAAATLVETLARAMHHAHEQGIVHRDLKPANVLMASGGREPPEALSGGSRPPLATERPPLATPKISDFGLAKFLDATADTQTRTGDILGTPLYMAPEQAAGRIRDIGPGTDIYALGAILYEMLTGRPPFVADSHLNLVTAIANEEPLPPSRLRRGVPPDLATICLKCLEKSPLRRYQSAAELADDLRRFLNEEPILARPTGPVQRLIKWARRKPALAALVVVSIVSVIALLVAGSLYNVRLQQALQTAEHEREEHRQSLVTLVLSHGQQQLQDQEWLGSLVYCAAGLKLDPSNEVHRWRLGSVLQRCPRLAQLFGHDRSVTCIALAPGGKQLASGSEDGIARIWNLDTGQQIGQELKHQRAIVYVAFSPDGATVVTASKDRSARLWDARTGEPRGLPLQHGRPIEHACLTRDGRWLATAFGTQEIHLWDVDKQLRTHVLQLSGKVTCLTAAPRDSVIGAGSADGRARVWDSATGQPVSPELQHKGTVHDVQFSPDGQLLATAGADGLALVWRVSSGERVGPDLRHPEPVKAVAFHSRGNLLATACEDDCARIWDRDTGKQVVPTLRHPSEVLSVAFSPDGKWLASTGDDNTVRLWDTTTGELLPPCLPHSGGITQLLIAPDSGCLITANSDHLVRVWQLNLNRLQPDETQAVVVPAEPGATAAVLSPSGERQLKLEHTAGARLFQRGNEQPLATLRHASTITGAVFSPDSQKALTWSDDNTARLWNAVNGQLLTTPLRHRGTVLLGCFDPRSQLVATVSRDLFLRVWVAQTGRLLAPPLRHHWQPRRVLFSEDSTRISTISTDGQERTWRLQRDDRPLDELMRQAELLSASRIDFERGLLPLEAPEVLERWRKMTR